MSELDLEKWKGRSKPGIPMFGGDEEVRNAFIRSKGIGWTASYIDPASWRPESRTLITASGQAYDRIMQQGSILAKQLGVTVLEGGERIQIRRAQEAYERESGATSRPFAIRDAAE
jgi:hypothetical protein